MVFIPVGYSQCTFKIETPAPSGIHLSTLTLGVHVAASAAAASAANGHFTTLWGEIGSTESRYVGVEVRDLVNAYEEPADEAGTYAGAIPPPQVAALVRKGTGRVGRTERGRWFLPCVFKVDDLTDSGTIKDTPFGNLQTDLDLFAAAFTGDSALGDAVILHSGSSDETPTVITSFNLQRQVATQRRRLR